MRSLIIIEVENGEDTDGIERFVNHVQQEYSPHMAEVYPGRVVMLDYTLRVDIANHYVIRSWDKDTLEEQT